MQMLLLLTKRSPAALAIAGALTAVLLAGCASKNPLMDDTTAAAPAAASATATAKTPVLATTDSASATTANSGLQRTTPSSTRRFLGVLSPYRVDIPQGNFVSEEMLTQLKEGMTPAQVQFTLGTPLTTDMFHADRWDYVFRMLKGNGEVLSSRVTVFFKDGKLSRFEGGNLPTEVDYLALIAGAAPKKRLEAPLAPAAAPSSVKTTP